MRFMALIAAAVSAALLSTAPASAYGGGVTFGMSRHTLIHVADDIDYSMPLIALGITALHHEDWTGAAQFTVLEALTVGTSYGIRSFVKKTSPDGTDKRSFPSMEAAIASPASGYLWRRYGWEYGLPTFVIKHMAGYWLDRAGKHKLTDTLPVLAMSLGFNMFITTRYHKPIEVGVAQADDGTPMLAMRMTLD